MAIISLPSARRERQFDRKIRPHLPALYRYAYRLCGSRDDAEDLIQDLLIRLYEKQAVPDSLDKPQTWLLKVLYRQFIDWQRKARRTPTLLGDEHGDDFLANQHQPRDTPEHAVEQSRLQRDLGRAIDSLNAEQRTVILLHDVEGFTLQELQTALDTPVGTLKSRLHRARRQLREFFGPDREPAGQSDRVTGQER
ncbi:MAG: RNA polymerase sigma factor [Thiohalophilus sp.]